MVIATSAAFSAPASAASYGGFAEVRIVDSPTAQSAADSQPVSVVASNRGGTALVGTSAVAAARVETAGVHLVATSSSIASPGPALIYSSGYATGGFTDDFVFGSTLAPLGSLVTLTVRFNVSGAIATETVGVGAEGLGGGGTAGWRASFSLLGQDDAVRWEGYETESRGGGDATRDGNATPGDRLFSFNARVGERLYLGISGTVDAGSGAQILAGASGSVSGAGQAQFGSTLSWGGIVSAVDANQQALTHFSAVSTATGFDYTQAYVSSVPEPQAAALWLAGLLACVAGATYRRQLKA
ncbi:hypothetical protein ASD88_02085 [Pelomonas sp. Root662]|nr:hypothetical protein ASC81_02085 [Pelomonas sp. Root405]KRA77687.1 hypothetical protein ASD88_02085 [Pelomonas sp. Root662]